MASRAESVAALVGGVLLLAGIASYSWRAALIAGGVLLILSTVAWRHESRDR
jgi:Kef-type K+ transport system membrane component KefB